ncbi:DUF31 family protein [Mycoplasmoides pneumoniae]|uniref:DUF31 family protein n=1 Tax=Mycoplasmoides pneumoniae TaxID=2104 RepID=UPI0002B84621|nr:DUF31 family protein [Mycoplasmoides pneumoniae]AGC04025.1 hypothetical protein C985_0088 [Mycoplasmoides pneumoniae M129-B7]ARI11426.1 hypothetical protein B7R95_00460 [Mycoplasmoides pneumoniae]ARI12138.1 hypothetical protein B7R97_00460 [Mycoplasmoides pneumoniae]ARI12843.1 hypothetical protein B7R98_00460 [Mycoplasmoides pneumoniae]ARI13547.1 hypothetical protein B7R99_00460 [Mycoplasmoides pneumoniae]
MVKVWKIGFGVFLPTALLFSACSFKDYIPTPSFRKDFSTENNFVKNKVPGKDDIYSKFYDLTFSLNFVNNQAQEFGTGWLIDWKGDENKNLSKNKEGQTASQTRSSSEQTTDQDANLFTAYIATNLHVADGLKNDQDYAPYNKDGWGQPYPYQQKTQSFLLGKYTKPNVQLVKTNYEKPEDAVIEQKLKEDSLLFIQTSTLPKTAYAAIDPVNFSYNPTRTNGFWTAGKYNVYNGGNSIGNYADFAVIEVPLVLSNPNDAKIYQEWIRPATQAYKYLGDVEGLFAKKGYRSYIQDFYHLLGYPVTKNTKSEFILGQSQGTVNHMSFSNDESNTTNTITKASLTQQPHKEQSAYVVRESGLPTLTMNVDKYTGAKGTHLVNVDQITDLSLGDGLIDFGGLSRFILQYHNVNYKQFGYGTILWDTNFAGGSSGSAIFNQNKQINSIYFGALVNVTTDRNENVGLGLGQILRAPNTFNSSHEVPYSYDLIFGDVNTTNFYAQFAKKHNTHMWSKIQSTQNGEIGFHKNSKTGQQRH